MPPHNHHEWYFNSEGYLSPYRTAELLKKLAPEIYENRGGKLGDVEIVLPEEIYVIVRYERTPKGDLTLKIETKWGDGPGKTGQHPISEFLGRGASENAKDRGLS